MIDVMLSLEPYRQDADITLYNELESIQEVTFFINGEFEIGFEVNSKQHYVQRFKNSSLEYYS